MSGSIVTFSLQWGTIRDPTIPQNPYHFGFEYICGWTMKINGIRSSDRDSFRATFKTEVMLETKTSNGKKYNLQITPKQKADFDADKGADMKEPPLEFITECLNCVAKLGYKVVSSHSLATTDNLIISVWTLQQQ